MNLLRTTNASVLFLSVFWGCGGGGEDANSNAGVGPDLGSGSSGQMLGTGSEPGAGSGGESGLGTGGTPAVGGGIATGGAVNTGGAATGGSTVVLDADLTIDTNTKYQTMDGFGAALPMWGSASSMWTTNEVHSLVGLGQDELGLSIVRTIIDPDSSRWSFAVDNLKEAKSYGDAVQILASPWSPPASMKTNGSTTNGGKLKTDSYGAYASHLNDYVKYMAGQGITIDVVSIQNEPDWHPDYESCDWSGDEFKNFLKNNASAIVGPKLMIAESLQFTRSLTDPSLNDSTAVNNFDLIGGHIYGAEAGGKLSAYPLAEQKGKNVWMTEYNFHQADGDGAAIWGGEDQKVWDETLDEVLDTVDKSIRANWSAYIWWWGRRFYSFVGDGESAYGTQKGQVLKRGYAFSHFAKFVRPGYVRVAANEESSVEGINTSAYIGPKQVVVVLLNMSQDSFSDIVIDVPMPVVGASAYVTSRTENRAVTEVAPENHYATVGSVPARSVVTVVIDI